MGDPADLRNAELLKIQALVLYINDQAGFVQTGNSPVIIENSNAASEYLSRVFMYMRKRYTAVRNGNAGMAALDLKYGKINIPAGGAQKSIVEFRNAYFIAFPNTAEFNYTISTPIVTMLTAFKLVYNEGRLGNAKFAYNRNRKGRDTSTADYGLSGIHVPQLFGLSFKPERRPGLLRCMGPATLAIHLVNGQGEQLQYREEIRHAFIETNKYLEVAPQLGAFFMRTPVHDIGQVLSLLCDVLNITGSQQQRKIFPPLHAWLRFRISTTVVGGVNAFDFSGAGAYYLYSVIRQYTYSARGLADNAAKLTEAIFHGIWGTYGEDFGILGAITTRPRWFQRREMGPAYAKADAVAQDICTLPAFTHNAKLRQIQTNMGNSHYWACSRPVFAGRRKRMFSAAFDEIMTTGTRTIQAQSVDATHIGLTMYLSRLKDSLLREKEKFENIGTLKWHLEPCVLSEGGIAYYGQEVAAFRPIKTGVFFFWPPPPPV